MRWPRLRDLKRFIRATAIAAERAFISWVQPASSVAVGIARDAVRSRTELVAENAFLRQQLIVAPGDVPQVLDEEVSQCGPSGNDLAYFNLERPHQGINQRIPDDDGESRATAGARVVELPVLGELHHAYRRAA